MQMSMQMSLRDWLAGQAIAGGLATGITSSQILAARAYDIADAMIAERSKSSSSAQQVAERVADAMIAERSKPK